ncbi:fibroblast growth factor receptor 4-like isoform X1 [Montipora foliosa]|uniref:fibroblast growth factor receptor 4-like isoform X1 n=1 Tax=Montipora foliosa TaxID=591990 RepID=UPI0035F2163D
MLGALIVLFAFKFNLSDCASIQWKAPPPTQNISEAAVGDPEEHLSRTSLLEGTINGTLSWHFSLSSDLTFVTFSLKFNDTLIGKILPSGQFEVLQRFRNKYAIDWFPFQRITLIIFYVTTEMNGIFSCAVVAQTPTGFVTFTSKNKVEVVVPPKTTLALTVRPKTTLALAVRPKITLANKLYVEREQTASLNCVVEGNPIPSIQWSPCDLPRISCNGQHLSISRVQTSRAYYTCTAVNDVGRDSESTVLIIGGYNIYLRITTIGECENKDSVWRTLQNELIKVLANTQSYNGAELMDVRCESLIFELVLRFNIEVAEDLIISTIRNATVDGRFGELSVNASSIIGVPPVIKTATTSSPTDKTTQKTNVEKCSCTTFVIVIVILIAIIVALIVSIIWLHRRDPVPKSFECRRDKVSTELSTGTEGQKRACKEPPHASGTENTPSVEMDNAGYEQLTPPNGLQVGQYAPLNTSARSWEIPRHHVTIEKVIGKGAFGQVAKATADGLQGMPQKTLVAVKMLKAASPESDKKYLLSELEVMKTLKPHPHVVKLIGCVTQSEPFLVLIEYVPHGDLLGYLRKSRGLHDTYFKDPDIKPQTSLTSQQLMKFAWQVADGMQYLSSRSIIHRDLAARNVWVGEREICKVTAFGMARDVGQENIYERKTKGRLPAKWTAYEALMYGTYTTKSDVWSFGVLLYEILTIGGSPYPRMDGREIAKLLQEGYRMPKPQHVDYELYKIMLSCWLEDPIARPTFLNLKDKLENMENQHKEFINDDIYDDIQLYASVEDLAA